MSLVTLLTPTGGRPQAWALCQHFIAKQDVKDVQIQWVVVYDTPTEPLLTSEEALKAKNITIEFHKSPKDYRPGINTQRFQMDEAIKHVKGDYVFTVEDDDCYLPNYIDTMLYLLQRWDIVGQANSRYYNIKERSYKEWRNYNHTSLCETAMKGSKLDLLDRAVNSGQLYFDVALWEIVRNEKHSHLLFNHIGLICGMKGLPGKLGIGGGHHPDTTFIRDAFFEKLKEWVGLEYAKNYMNLATTMVKK